MISGNENRTHLMARKIYINQNENEISGSHISQIIKSS